MEEEAELEIDNSEVQEKYKTAGEVANKVLTQVVVECVPGKKIFDVCTFGDKMISDQIALAVTKKVEKGSAFPTCISVNNTVGHFSPLIGDASVLAEGDLVKVELGVHVDGFVALIGHSFVCTANQAVPTTGRKADVICAAHYAAECAHRLIKPGRKNTEVTDAIQKVADIFKCQPMEGVLSHQMKRFVIDGNHVIANKAILEQKVEEFEFEENSVYAVDIVISTGEGKSRELETRTTVYKRAVDQTYLLKMKSSRYVYNEINSRFPTFPFSVRSLDEKRAKLGITEMVNHDMLHAYPVLYEKPGEFVAQFTFTVLVLPSSTTRITGHPLPFVQSEHKVEDKSVLDIMQMSTKRNKKKKSGNKKKSDKGEKTAQPQTEKMDTN